MYDLSNYIYIFGIVLETYKMYDLSNVDQRITQVEKVLETYKMYDLSNLVGKNLFNSSVLETYEMYDLSNWDIIGKFGMRRFRNLYRMYGFSNKR